MNTKKAPTMIVHDHFTDGHMHDRDEPNEERDPKIDDIIGYLYDDLSPKRKAIVERALRTSSLCQECLEGHRGFKEDRELRSAADHKQEFLAFLISMDVGGMLTSLIRKR